ncbi:hypothetical protein ACLOJK_036240 [Asimina triloba]
MIHCQPCQSLRPPPTPIAAADAFCWVRSQPRSIQKLHTSFLDFIKLQLKWASHHILKWVKRSSIARSSSSSSRSGLVGKARGVQMIRRQHSHDSHHHDQKLWACGHSNSFHAQAIAECLDFIKTSSLRVGDQETVASGSSWGARQGMMRG